MQSVSGHRIEGSAMAKLGLTTVLPVEQQSNI